MTKTLILLGKAIGIMLAVYLFIGITLLIAVKVAEMTL